MIAAITSRSNRDPTVLAPASIIGKAISRAGVPVIERNRLRAIFAIALPIIGGMASQNLFNLVDTAMVGMLGPAALAAVGIANYTCYVAMAAVMGLSSGVQAMAARRIGAGDSDGAAVPLNAGLALALAMGFAITIGLDPWTGELFSLLNNDPAVVAEGVPYLHARFVGIVGVGMNFAFRGYWSGIGMTRLYLAILFTIQLSNVGLNYVLIFGAFGLPAMGAEGAGLGTTIAIYIGTGLHLFFALRRARGNGFMCCAPSAATIATLMRLSIPAALQQFFFALGITALFWIIGRIGTAEVAVSNVVVTLALVAVLPGVGLGMAALSLVSEALGRDDAADARRWGWEVATIACVIMGLIGLPAVVAPQTLLAGFLHDSEVVRLGITSVQLIGGLMVFDAIGVVLGAALLGAGAASLATMTTVGTQWLLGLPLAWLAGPQLGFGLVGVWASWVAYRMLLSGCLTLLWARSDWATIRI